MTIFVERVFYREQLDKCAQLNRCYALHEALNRLQMMNEAQYDAWTRRIRQNPSGRKLLCNANDVLTLIGYASYLILLIVCFVDGFMGDWSQFIKVVLVPGISFGLITLARNIINEPRPYEMLDIKPLIGKDSNGKSMPSRHAFSMFMIAFSWIVPGYPVIVAILTLVGVALAIIRVLGGVHYPRDVIVGALTALVIALIFYIIL